ncbi:hypothetical protein ACFC3F_01630, partial [Microbacterium sp. NPDC055910]|uniref:hypothetical protein n=1 Tax=Microbacterium sp. NPDC055910 TaxID=3345659 RepID=UPI0035E14468
GAHPRLTHPTRISIRRIRGYSISRRRGSTKQRARCSSAPDPPHTDLDTPHSRLLDLSPTRLDKAAGTVLVRA